MEVKQICSIAEIDPNSWSQLVGQDDPFLSYEFLSALEQSGCVSAASGWCPKHITVYDQDKLLACTPLYEKNHSWGEYVFDHIWADAYHRNGKQYYPKWLTAIPFTPCAGKRFLINPTANAELIIKQISNYVRVQADIEGISSWHCLFPEQPQIDWLCDSSMLLREDVQFQWQNRGYRDFQDYLQHFTSSHRKKIKRERRGLMQRGVEMIRLLGSEITSELWLVFYQFYAQTYLKRGQQPYLSLTFFQLLAADMPEKLLLVLARKDTDYVGAALSFVGRDTLYGRYWGGLQQYRGLHFEACYYQGLEFCIEQGLQRFDSGAQGEHKISRGFEPVSRYSVHWIRDAQFATAISAFLQREKTGVQHYKQQAASYLPFKHS